VTAGEKRSQSLGFIRTGRYAKDLLDKRNHRARPVDRDLFLLETSVPGISPRENVVAGRTAIGVVQSISQTAKNSLTTSFA
jgi:hypothetical protein